MALSYLSMAAFQRRDKHRNNIQMSLLHPLFRKSSSVAHLHCISDVSSSKKFRRRSPWYARIKNKNQLPIHPRNVDQPSEIQPQRLVRPSGPDWWRTNLFIQGRKLISRSSAGRKLKRRIRPLMVQIWHSLWRLSRQSLFLAWPRELSSIDFIWIQCRRRQNCWIRPCCNRRG